MGIYMKRKFYVNIKKKSGNLKLKVYGGFFLNFDVCFCLVVNVKCFVKCKMRFLLL